MAEKRRRRPGGGRKPLDPHGVVAPVRFTADDWKAIKRLASRHSRAASKEIRAAVHYWLRLLEKPEQHIGALILLIAILVRRIEAHTGRKWNEDPLTGAAVREYVERLIFHFAPTPTERIVVPPEIENIAFGLVSVAEDLHPKSGVPQMPLALLSEDWAALALIVQDLGSGWQRNRKVWLGRRGDAT